MLAIVCTYRRVSDVANNIVNIFVVIQAPVQMVRDGERGYSLNSHLVFAQNWRNCIHIHKIRFIFFFRICYYLHTCVNRLFCRPKMMVS